MNLNTTRNKLIAPAIIIILLMLIISYVLLERVQTANIIKHHFFISTHLASFIDAEIEEDAKTFTGLINIVKNNSDIQLAWKQGFREKLYDASFKVYKLLNTSHRITHFYFHDINKVNVLRIHFPERFGDKINRHTLAQAVESQKTSYGIEIGTLGQLVLRVVSPWIIDGKLVGYIELGKEIEHIVDKAGKILGINVLTLIDKNKITRKTWEQNSKKLGRKSKWSDIDDYIIVNEHTTGQIKQEYATVYDIAHNASSGKAVTNKENYFFAGALPIYDMTSLSVGYYVFFNDISQAVHNQKNSSIVLILASSIFFILVLTFYFRYVTKIELSRMNLINLLQTEIDNKKLIEINLIDAKENAEKANKAKSEFLSSMSHELRTPLNAILGFGQLLESYSKQPLTKDQKESVDFILSSGNHLLNLVNDVLELSAIEAGKLEISSEPIHLLALVTDIESLITPMTTKENIQLNIESEEELIGLADYTKLKQVLINLINNAIKYNKQNGSVTINWASTEHNTFKLNVIDTGIGISENKQNEVFGAFNRLGQETSSIEGTGIGLVVTKNLVEMMGGQIGFNSTQGQGSTFWVELPLAESQSIEEVNAPQPEKKEENAVITKIENKQVLYVEDNPTNRRLMQSVFAQQPYTLKMVESGELGIETALAHNFDLVLMDLHLPGIDGKEVAKQLRATEYYKNIPILAVTAAAMKHDIESAEGLFDNYITKPLDISLLLNILNKYL